ncbi:ABC transporter permease subunit [Staphylococcus gallinarum]|uniref:ABC transporter permease n=1 Tax=Staphylococcus gallinarum TaxID=1293 RepID=A0A418HKD5_STAGA|nr:hypothetical protein [Staphylococcus gallinarum]MCD8827222.1 hypothetical protein [Staphylococcus gallinarum]RIL40974.1 hypothetical protein BUZ01_13825 [Staphylococcus gallinarum]RIO92895.1 hypothetical protein BUZ04_05900 [Staphylococcus gallinarum]
MLSIALKEFTSLFKSIKSFFIIVVIIGISLGLAKIIDIFGGQINSAVGSSETPFSAGLLLAVLLTGPLFTFTLSHNIINEEVKTRTIRFLATKTARNNILLGKFIGALLFWGICLLIATILIIWYSHQFYFLEFLQCLTFISYYLALAMLLSVFIDNTVSTNFLGIIISLVMTVLGIWSLNSDHVLLIIFKYITPYFYFFKDSMILPFVIIIFTFLFLVISLYKFNKRDL